MNRQPLLLGILILGVAAQWWVPAGMILKREQALRHGETFRFRVAPVDPYDAFRGRYVALNPAATVAPTTHRFRQNQPLYLRLENDADGFARLAEAAPKPGREGIWMRARAVWNNDGGWGRAAVKSASEVRVALPLDRFYMDEKSAPRAEQLYQRRAGVAASNTWIQVRVDRRLAVIEDLYIDGRPIRQVLKEMPPEEKP
jgi:uncharacterized membrane-anchored protein